jgi:adenine-specific DNA methylase
MADYIECKGRACIKIWKDLVEEEIRANDLDYYFDLLNLQFIKYSEYPSTREKIFENTIAHMQRHFGEIEECLKDDDQNRF